MNIAVFIKKTTLHTEYGGLEVQNKLLCEGLVARGHKVTVYSPKLNLSLDSTVEQGVNYVFVSCTYRYLFSRLDANSWYNRSYQKFANDNSKLKFDIVLGQSSAGIGVIERKKSLGIKVISIAHGSSISEFKTYLYNHNGIVDLIGILKNLQYTLRQFFGRQRQYILHSNKVVAVSSYVKASLVDETFPPDNLITVIHNGVMPGPPPVFNTTKYANRLVYVGQVEKSKGIHLLMDIANDSDFKDFELFIVGDGVMRSILYKNKTSVGAKLTIFGKLPYDQTIQLLRQSAGAIFVFPTRRIEGFPMVLVEAMFAGLPVVANQIGGVKDAVIDGVTGYLINPGDTRAFKQQILRLAADADKVKQMGNSAYDVAKREFSLDNMLDKYENLFKEVLTNAYM